MWRCISQCTYPYCNKISSSWLLIGLINSGETEILVAVECEPSCHFTIGTVLVSLKFPPALPYMPILWMMVHRGQIITIHCASLPILLKCISEYFINLTISNIGSYYKTRHIWRGWKWECCLAERKGTQSYHRDRNRFKGENGKCHQGTVQRRSRKLWIFMWTSKSEDRLKGSEEEHNFRNLPCTTGTWAGVCVMYHTIHSISQGLIRRNLRYEAMDYLPYPEMAFVHFLAYFKMVAITPDM